MTPPSDRAVVLGVTADHGFAAGALLASILATDPSFNASVVIFHDGLPEDQQAAFLALWPHCRFRRFALAEAADRLGLTEAAAQLQPCIARYSPLALAKLDLPLLLADHARVLWLDADTLVRGPLAPLWDFDTLAWRPLPAGAFARREKVLAAFPEVTRHPAVPLLNGGVIGLSRKFIERGGSARLLHDIASQLAHRTQTPQLDELAWYLTAASLGLPVTPFPLGFNHPVAAPGMADARVAHAIGPHKFWNATPLMHLFPDWAVHHARWVACGGQPYTGPVTLDDTHPKEASAVLKAAEMRSYWLTVFAALRPNLPKGMVVDLRHDQPALRIFLHGQPDTQHLCLLRLPNPRRLGLELHLTDAQADHVATAVCQALRGARLEKTDTLSLPTADIATALRIADGVISG